MSTRRGPGNPEGAPVNQAVRNPKSAPVDQGGSPTRARPAGVWRLWVRARAARCGRARGRRGRGRLPGGDGRERVVAPLPAADAHRHPLPAVRDDHRRHRPGLRRPRAALVANPFVLVLAGFTLVMAVLMAARALGRLGPPAHMAGVPAPTRLLRWPGCWPPRGWAFQLHRFEVGVRSARPSGVSCARRQEDDHDRGADPTRPAERGRRVSPLAGRMRPSDQPPLDYRPADTTPGGQEQSPSLGVAGRAAARAAPGRHLGGLAPARTPAAATAGRRSGMGPAAGRARAAAGPVRAAAGWVRAAATGWIPAATGRAVPGGRQRHGRERRLGSVLCADLAHRPDLLPGRQAPRGPLPRHAVDRLRGAVDPGSRWSGRTCPVPSARCSASSCSPSSSAGSSC